jgi:hypothetical protein
VPQFHVLEEVKGLGHGDVAIGLEQHHCNGATWEHITDDKLCQDVETNSRMKSVSIRRIRGQSDLLGVTNSLDHSNWDQEYNSQGH